MTSIQLNNTKNKYEKLLQKKIIAVFTLKVSESQKQ
jgi:hypothetical protein